MQNNNQRKYFVDVCLLHQIVHLYIDHQDDQFVLLVETNSYWWLISGQGRYGSTPAIINTVTGNEPVAGGAWAFPASFILAISCPI